jgi:6-phosphogluconolactonase
VKADARHEIRIFADLEALSRAAADFFVSLSQSAIKSENRFAVALSGGSTPRRFFSLLASSPCQESIKWSSTHFFWADERCVSKKASESNYNLAYSMLLSRVPVPGDNIHRIRGEDDPERAARDYEDCLREFFGRLPLPVFDLIILGAGADGHTASIFPDAAVVRERTRLAVPVYAEAPNPARVTLTLPVLNNAAQVLFLASGRAKNAVLHEILEDGNPKRYPAGLVQPVRGRLTWLIDRDAASLLSLPPFPRR